MGCGLNKLEKFDEKRPGNIYSTLKRPHVETKIDVSYEYRYVDFTTIIQAQLPGTSAVRIASLRDLPEKLQDLYQQGFTVVAIHPFVQSTEGNERIPQEEMFRVVLIKKTERNSTCDQNIEDYCLDVEPCTSSDQQADQKLIPDLVKRLDPVPGMMSTPNSHNWVLHAKFHLLLFLHEIYSTVLNSTLLLGIQPSHLLWIYPFEFHMMSSP